jgi:hypothetical protein
MHTAIVLFALLALAAGVALAGPTPPTWSACGGGELTSMTTGLEPPIPRRGADARVSASTTLAVPFKGVIAVSVGAGTMVHDLPREPFSAPAGPLLLERTLRVPSIVPAGRYHAESRLIADDGTVVLCASVAFSVV